MEKERSIKILTVVALVVAVIGMSLGFAAFSMTLKVESSTTVTPNPDDFKMVIYGWGDKTCYASLGYENCLNSTTISYPSVYYGEANPAKIDNATGIINNLYFSLENFTVDTNLGEISYYFLVRNEGKYTIYLNQNDLYPLNNVSKTCIPVGDTSADMVASACSNIYMVCSLHDLSGNRLVPRYSTEIEPGSFVIAKIGYAYNHSNDAIPDGPFEIKFDDIKIRYSTAE